MKRLAHLQLIQRLAELKASPHCIIYYEMVRLGPKPFIWFSAFGAYPTAEIFLEVTDGMTTRVKSFFSRHRCLSPDERRKEMALVDIADAFTLARRMCRYWPQLPATSGLVAGYRE